MIGAWHAPVSMADKESVDVRSEVHRPQERIASQGARVLLMDGTAVESAFALLLTKVTKPPYPAKISYNRHNWRKYKLCAISGTLFRRRGEEHNDEKNDQRHDWSWIAGS